MTSEPLYLVQTRDGVLHGYWNLDILFVDLRVNSDPSVRLYVLTGGMKVRYEPTTLEALRERAG